MTAHRWLDRVRTSAQRVLRATDPRRHIRDLHVYGGLLLAAAGGWQLSHAVTLLGVGVILMLFGVVVPRRPPAGA